MVTLFSLSLFSFAYADSDAAKSIDTNNAISINDATDNTQIAAYIKRGNTLTPINQKQLDIELKKYNDSIQAKNKIMNSVSMNNFSILSRPVHDFAAYVESGF